MTRQALALAALLPLMAPAAAQGAHRPYLSAAVAKRAIDTVEQLYWKGHGIQLTVGHCRRHSRVSVSCAADGHTADLSLTFHTTDSATLLRHNIIRVHATSSSSTVTQ